MRKNEIDFSNLNQTALRKIKHLLSKWLPRGRFEGKEYVALNPTRPDTSFGSFKINHETGEWADFATNDAGGDIVSLYAYLNGLSQIEAAIKLSSELGTMSGYKNKTNPKNPKWTPLLLVPESAQAPPARHYKFGKYSNRFEYRDIDSNMCCCY